jgi:hypothetical protein
MEVRRAQDTPLPGSEVPVPMLSTLVRPCHRALVEVRLSNCHRISGYDLHILTSSGPVPLHAWVWFVTIKHKITRFSRLRVLEMEGMLTGFRPPRREDSERMAAIKTICTMLTTAAPTLEHLGLAANVLEHP